MHQCLLLLDLHLELKSINSFDTTTALSGSVAADDNGTPGILTDDFLVYTPPIAGLPAGQSDTFQYDIEDFAAISTPATVTIDSIAILAATDFGDTLNLSNSPYDVQISTINSFGSDVVAAWYEKTNSGIVSVGTSNDAAQSFVITELRTIPDDHVVTLLEVEITANAVHIFWMEDLLNESGFAIDSRGFYTRSIGGAPYDTPVQILPSGGPGGLNDVDMATDDDYAYVSEGDTFDVEIFRIENAVPIAPVSILTSTHFSFAVAGHLAVEDGALFLIYSDDLLGDGFDDLVIEGSFNPQAVTPAFTTKDTIWTSTQDANPVAIDIDAWNNSVWFSFDDDDDLDFGNGGNDIDTFTRSYIGGLDHSGGVTSNLDLPIQIAASSAVADFERYHPFVSADVKTAVGNVGYVVIDTGSSESFQSADSYVFFVCSNPVGPSNMNCTPTLLASTFSNVIDGFGHDIYSDGDEVTVALVTDNAALPVVDAYRSFNGGDSFVSATISNSEAGSVQGVRVGVGSSYVTWVDDSLGDFEAFFRTTSLPNSPPVSHWKAEGDATDEQGLNDGTFIHNIWDTTPLPIHDPVAQPQIFAPAIDGFAFDFTYDTGGDFNSDVVVVDPVTSFPTSAITTSFWMRASEDDRGLCTPYSGVIPFSCIQGKYRTTNT